MAAALPSTSPASCSSRCCTADHPLMTRRRSALRQQQRSSVKVRAGLLDTLLKPITSSGEVGAIRIACIAGFCLGSPPLPPLPPPPPPAAHTDCAPAADPPCVCLQRLPLNEGIANFYDESTGLWESMWVSSGSAARVQPAHRYRPPPPLPVPTGGMCALPLLCRRRATTCTTGSTPAPRPPLPPRPRGCPPRPASPTDRRRST